MGGKRGNPKIFTDIFPARPWSLTRRAKRALYIEGMGTTQSDRFPQICFSGIWSSTIYEGTKLENVIGALRVHEGSNGDKVRGQSPVCAEP